MENKQMMEGVGILGRKGGLGRPHRTSLRQDIRGKKENHLYSWRNRCVCVGGRCYIQQHTWAIRRQLLVSVYAVHFLCHYTSSPEEDLDYRCVLYIWLHVGLGNTNSIPYICALKHIICWAQERIFHVSEPQVQCLGAGVCLLCLYGQEAARPMWQEYQQRAEIIEDERWVQGRSYGATKRTLVFTPSEITSYWRVHDLT